MFLYCVYFGEGNANPLQYSWLENPMDRGAWQATDHVVAKSWMLLSTHTTQLCIMKTTLSEAAFLKMQILQILLCRFHCSSSI